MKAIIGFVLLTIILISCTSQTDNPPLSDASNSLVGTWKLLTGTTIQKTDTTVTDYTKGKEFIKIINNNHFAFLSHDLNKGKDSATALFSSGGGSYSLKDSAYTEHLEYCNDRQWEGNSFDFTIVINGDTLTQTGVEKVENIGINRINIERYVKLKN